MLPGAQLFNGVSSYVFGSNMSQDWATHTVRNTPAMQALIKSAGISLMRCMIVQNSDVSVIDQTVQACQAMNTQMLVILHHSDLAWNQKLVGRLGNNCNLYEFSNEPDLASPAISPSAYAGFWNQHIPVLRSLNKNAQFIGPALGVFGSFDGYVVPWLQACKTSGVLPDGVSFHIYPCTGSQWDAPTCSTRATSFSSAYAHANTAIINVLGHPLPICLTEWGIDADAKHAYANDPSFVPSWTKTAIDDIAKVYDMACLWDAGGNAGGGVFDLVSTQNFQPNPNGQYGAMVERIQHYLSGTPTPVPTPTPTPTPVPSGVTSLALSISNMVSSVNSAGNKLLTNNSGTPTPPSAQSYTTIGTQTGFVEITAQGGMAITSTSIGAPTGKGFYLDPATLNLAGNDIVAGSWSDILRLNAAKTITNPQSGLLVADLYFRAWKYNTMDKTYTHIVTLWSSGQTLTPNFTNYPLLASNVAAMSFAENETLYFDQWANVTQNNNNSPTQGIRYNRLATGTVGDPFGTCQTPGYQATVAPPVVVPPTVTLNDTGLTPGTYEAVIDTTIGNKPTSIPITLTINS